MYKIISFRYESVIQKNFFCPPITNPFLRPCYYLIIVVFHAHISAFMICFIHKKTHEVSTKGPLTLIKSNSLQEKATKWYSDGEIDGLTTNGILLMHPVGGFCVDSKPGIWREVSVGGGVYALRESRSTPQKSSLVSKHARFFAFDS